MEPSAVPTANYKTNFSHQWLVRINLTNRFCIWIFHEDEGIKAGSSEKFANLRHIRVARVSTGKLTTQTLPQHYGVVPFLPRLLQPALLPWAPPMHSKHARASRICGRPDDCHKQNNQFLLAEKATETVNSAMPLAIRRSGPYEAVQYSTI
jgi:hypothetical protein